MKAFREKMAGEEAQAQYRRRGRVVEFCHAWIKSKLGLRQFHVRGLVKVADGNAVGLPHLQPATMDPLKLGRGTLRISPFKQECDADSDENESPKQRRVEMDHADDREQESATSD